MEKEKIYTGFNFDNEEFTCSEVCPVKSKEEYQDVYYCCKLCDRADTCDDVCAYDDMNKCDFEWCVQRCNNCGEIISRDEDSRTVYSVDTSEYIQLCENCWDVLD